MLKKYSYNILNSSWARCLVLCPFSKVWVFTAGYYIAITGTVSLKPWVCVPTACKISSLAECTFEKSVFFWEIQTSGSQECKSFRNWRIFWLWRCWGISQWTLQATELFSKSRWSWFWYFLSWSSKQVAHCFLNVHWRKRLSILSMTSSAQNLVLRQEPSLGCGKGKHILHFEQW